MSDLGAVLNAEERQERYERAMAVAGGSNRSATTPRQVVLNSSRKFTVHIALVETIFMVLLGLYGIGSVLLGIHIGSPDTSSYYGSTVSDAQTTTAWVVAVGGVLTAAFAALLVDLVLRRMKYMLTASLDIKNVVTVEETVA